ncbi:MAG: Stk1 family PASTA domain-containing Ser/Thr kinase [Oscillospiraceae bacterium]|jgi:serine/threonine-protein kinase|nr:Stk1 family PASTA domain-containing Ser/Thr kinase [Oscillospiraceae bacterium]
MDNNDKLIGMMLDNRYEILEKIGSGGMAVVYKARCHRLNRLVAIKILKEDLAGDEDFRRRFKTESEAVALLSHANIVAVYDVSRSAGVDYIVMELIEGITLKQYINRKGLLNWKEALHFSMQIAKALSHAHARGIIHRDIKPHNIMILKDGSIKVADFGIARLLNTQNTMTQESLGSVHYISPEQAKGGHIDARTDIYSLGIVMYEMLTSHLPFVGDSAVSIAIQHISAIPLSPREINPDIPAGLEDITMRAMAPKPGSRYGSADELSRDLEEFRKNPAARFVYAADMTGDDVDAPDATRPVPSGAIIAKAAELTAPRRVAPRKSAAREPGADEYRKVKKRASNTASLVGIGILIVFMILAVVFLYNYVLRDIIFPPKGEEIAIPGFVGQMYGDVVADVRYKDVYEFTPKYDESEKPQGEILEQTPTEGTIREKQEGVRIKVTLTVSRGAGDVTVMPELINHEYREAEIEIRALVPGITVRVEGVYDESFTKDYVISTVPVAGERIDENSVVYIKYSQGPEIREVETPNLVGMSLIQAQMICEARNLVLDPVYVDDTAPQDQIIFQDHEPGELVEEKTKIRVQVSKGAALTPPPETPTDTPQPGTEPPVDFVSPTPAEPAFTEDSPDMF